MQEGYHMVNRSFMGVVSMVVGAKTVLWMHTFLKKIHSLGVTSGFTCLITPSFHLMFSPQFTALVGSLYELADCI